MPLILASLSAVFYGTADFLGGLAARRATALASTVWAQAVGFGLVLLALPLFPAPFPSAANAFWGVGAGLTGGLGVALLYYGFAVGRVSVIAPVTAVCSISIPVVVAMGLGERPGSSGPRRNRRGNRIGRPDQPLRRSTRRLRPRQPFPRHRSRLRVVIGGFFVCLARAGNASGLWPLLIARAASTLALAAAAGIAKAPLTLPRSVLPVVISCGALDMLANALYLIAVREGPLGLVATLASLYPASTVLLARVVLRERLQPVQSVGLACAAAAIVLITSR